MSRLARRERTVELDLEQDVRALRHREAVAAAAAHGGEVAFDGDLHRLAVRRLHGERDRRILAAEFAKHFGRDLDAHRPVPVGIGGGYARGRAFARADLLEAAGIAITLADHAACRASLAGYLTRAHEGRPFVTLKLAMTADGFIARPDGSSRWITGEPARAHAHRERARSDAILVGGATLRTDAPRLDVRLAGLEDRSPRRLVLTRGEAPQGWTALADPGAIRGLDEQYLLLEGGANVAEAFLSEGLVDRLLLYRAPVEFGEGVPAFGNPGPAGVPEGWTLADRRRLGSDTLEVYDRIR